MTPTCPPTQYRSFPLLLFYPFIPLTWPCVALRPCCLFTVQPHTRAVACVQVHINMYMHSQPGTLAPVQPLEPLESRNPLMLLRTMNTWCWLHCRSSFLRWSVSFFPYYALCLAAVWFVVEWSCWKPGIVSPWMTLWMCGSEAPAALGQWFPTFSTSWPTWNLKNVGSTHLGWGGGTCPITICILTPFPFIFSCC